MGEPGSVVGIAEGTNVGPVGVRVTAEGRADGKGVGLPRIYVGAGVGE